MSVRAVLEVEGQTLREIFAQAGSVLQDALRAEMTEILRGEGLIVEVPLNWETPQEISARLGITVKTFGFRMKHPRCPAPADVVRPGRGVEQLRSHTLLDKFLTHNKRSKPES